MLLTNGNSITIDELKTFISEFKNDPNKEMIAIKLLSIKFDEMLSLIEIFQFENFEHIVSEYRKVGENTGEKYLFNYFLSQLGDVPHINYQLGIIFE